MTLWLLCQLLIGLVTACVGAVMLLFGAVPLLLFLVYQWLRYSVWYSYSLADLLAWAGVSDKPWQSVTWLGVRKIVTWFLEEQLLVVMSIVGGAMTFFGFVLFFSTAFIMLRREHK